MDPIHQFEIKSFFTIARIGGVEIAFTNSALFMLIALLSAGAAALLLLHLFYDAVKRRVQTSAAAQAPAAA